MNLDEYKAMYELESHYWWFVARRKLVFRLIGEILPGEDRPILVDVGCGTGINQYEFSSFGTWIGIDSASSALRFSKLRHTQDLVQSNLELLPLKSGQIDLVTALDVLEHTDNDMAALSEIRRIMKPGGRILITVPAYNFLWSDHDEALHHRRRYVASEIRRKLTTAGFEVQRITYFITLLFLPILAVRFWQTVFKRSVYPKTSHIILPGWLNWMLIQLLRFEAFLLRVINFPFGVSIICLARKGRFLSDPWLNSPAKAAERKTKDAAWPR